jgi:tetratricopeptide (TPR) repeat protein
VLSSVQSAAQRGAWAQCLALSAGSTNVQVIYQRGWCAYNADRPMEAIASFRQAAGRGPTPETRRDATYGLLLSMLRLNMTEQAARVAAAAPLTRTQRIEIEGQILDQRGVKAYETGDYARAVAFLEAHERLTGVTRRDLALLRGYALVNLGRRAAARDLFLKLHSQLATPETRRALSQFE